MYEFNYVCTFTFAIVFMTKNLCIPLNLPFLNYAHGKAYQQLYTRT